MIKGFVFGKFLPFHNGHLSLINFASNQCDELTVLVCVSNKENISGEKREQWITESLINHKNIRVKVFEYDENELTNTSVSSEQVSKEWAGVFKSILPNHSILFTSETYGEYVSSFMQIKHVSYDVSRKLEPISATKLRNNLFENWNYLPGAVKKDFILKVAILGTESTGKSTLAIKLAKYYNCALVSELGRELIPDSTNFECSDLEKVAEAHAKAISKVNCNENPLLISDTNIYTTMSYSQFVFGVPLKVSETQMDQNKFDLTLYLTKEVDFVQDGTRMAENERNKLDDSHKAILDKNKIPYGEIKGDWNERFEKAKALIDNLIKLKQQQWKSHWREIE